MLVLEQLSCSEVAVGEKQGCAFPLALFFWTRSFLNTRFAAACTSRRAYLASTRQIWYAGMLNARFQLKITALSVDT
jgi:hypothetical protein